MFYLKFNWKWFSYQFLKNFNFRSESYKWTTPWVNKNYPNYKNSPHPQNPPIPFCFLQKSLSPVACMFLELRGHCHYKSLYRFSRRIVKVFVTLKTWFRCVCPWECADIKKIIKKANEREENKFKFINIILLSLEAIFVLTHQKTKKTVNDQWLGNFFAIRWCCKNVSLIYFLIIFWTNW